MSLDILIRLIFELQIWIENDNGNFYSKALEGPSNKIVVTIMPSYHTKKLKIDQSTKQETIQFIFPCTMYIAVFKTIGSKRPPPPTHYSIFLFCIKFELYP